MSDLNIFERLNAAMAEVAYVQKDTKVTGGGQNYSAVSHDAVVAVVRPAMVKHGIVAITKQTAGRLLVQRDVTELATEEKRAIKMHLYEGWYDITFYGKDKDDCITVTVQAHADDNGSKSTQKAASVAYKIALLKTFALESGDNEESRNYEADAYTEEQKNLFDELLESGNALEFLVFSKSVGNEVMTALNSSFSKGSISAGKKAVKDLQQAAWDMLKDYASQITVALDNHDNHALALTAELSGPEKKLLMPLLTEHQIIQLTKMKESL